MLSYDWEANAREEDSHEIRWLAGMVEAADSQQALKAAYAKAQEAASDMGCDPDSVSDVHTTLVTCDHVDVDERMDGGGACRACGKYLKGLAD